LSAIDRQPSEPDARLTNVEPLMVVPAQSRRTGPDAGEPSTWDADQAVTVLHAMHYHRLVRLAALLLHDRSVAEEVVQDAFVGLHRNWRRMRDPERAADYLRRCTVNGVRSVGRRSATARKHAPTLAVTPHAPDPATGIAERQAVMSALAQLPDRQREVLVLRYYGDLSEATIATTLGISRGAVKTHASRGLAALRPTMEQSR
jgi:RNA polymerase sigma-70 factor (sigma-E family)